MKGRTIPFFFQYLGAISGTCVEFDFFDFSIFLSADRDLRVRPCFQESSEQECEFRRHNFTHKAYIKP